MLSCLYKGMTSEGSMKEPDWVVEWTLESGETEADSLRRLRVFWCSHQLMVFSRQRIVLLSQNTRPRDIPSIGDGNGLEPFGVGKDGDLFFCRRDGNATIYFLARQADRLLRLEPSVPMSHSYLTNLYETGNGYGWITSISTEMTHFENDRGCEELAYHFPLDSGRLSRLQSSRELKNAGRLIGREWIRPIKNEKEELLFVDAADGASRVCPSRGLSYLSRAEKPDRAFGTVVTTSGRVGYKFTSIHHGVYAEFFPSGTGIIRVWQWVP